ncbi:MAG: DUF2897 family protein [Steroidobacterales bacterium]
MGRAIVIIIVVVGVIVGGLLVLRGSARTGIPDAEVLERAKQRAREQRAKDEQP